MSITEKIRKEHRNQIENIKNTKDKRSKELQIGALIVDLGKGSINAVSQECNCSWKYAKNCLELFQNKEMVKEGLNYLVTRTI